MAVFGDYIYELDGGETALIRLDVDQATEAGAVVGATTLGFHVLSSKSRKGFGVWPRRLMLKRLVGTAPNQKALYSRLPVCTPTAFEGFEVGESVTVNGTDWIITGVEREDLN